MECADEGGYIVDKGDVKALADMCIKVIDKDENIQTDIITNRYDKNICYEKYIQKYIQLQNS